MARVDRAHMASPPETSLLSKEARTEANSLPQFQLDTDSITMRRTEAAELARQLASPKVEAVGGDVSSGGNSPLSKGVHSTSPAICDPTAAPAAVRAHALSDAARSASISAAAGGTAGKTESPLVTGTAQRVSIPAAATAPVAAPIVLSLSSKSSPPKVSAPQPAASSVVCTTVTEASPPDAAGSANRTPAAATAQRKQQARGRQQALSSPLGQGKSRKAGGWPTPSPVVSPRPVKRPVAKATSPLPAAHVAKAFAAGKRNGSRVAPLKALPLQQRNNNSQE